MAVQQQSGMHQYVRALRAALRTQDRPGGGPVAVEQVDMAELPLAHRILLR